MKMSNRSTLLRTLSGLALGLGVAGAAHAFEVTYKCPGNVYSNTLGAKEAKDKGCSVFEGSPITVIQGPKPRSAASGTGERAGTPVSKVDPAEQRARDSDARRILESELKREEDRLVELKSEYNNGAPDKQGAENRNFQKYLDRVSEMKAGITRKEGDIAALKREIQKLPQ